MFLKIKKMDPEARIPQYQYDTDAGMDLHSLYAGVIKPGERGRVHTGIAIALPPGYEAQIRSRSGLAFKHGVVVLNSPGTIDEGYRGEIGILLINHGHEDYRFDKGDRIAQMVIQRTETRNVQIREVKELDETERGAGGFGSTGVSKEEKNSLLREKILSEGN